MTSRWLKQSICCWITTVLIILTFLLVWYLWEPTKQIHARNDTNRVKRSSAPKTYTPWIISWTYNNSITVIVPPNTTTSVTIPIKALKGFRNTKYTTGKGWTGYWWYLTGHVLRLDWSAFVTTQAGPYWPPGSSKEAKFFRDRVVLTHPGENLKLTFSLPDGEIRPPGATLFNNSCWGLLLWAWSSGADPYFPIVVCINNTMGTTEQPRMNNYTREAGVKAVSAPLDSVDGWFQVATGVSGKTNNWLLMVEQAARAANKDCVICMGPRPILQIIPAAITEECIIAVMNFTVPTDSCQAWDKVYPVTGPEKNKPIFSKNVATGNFSCIRLSGTHVKLGTLNHTRWCKYVTTVSLTFTPIARSDIWWWCGDDRIFDRLPKNSTGYCALVSLLLPVSVYPMSVPVLANMLNGESLNNWRRYKRSTNWQSYSVPTYIDAIGVPRGVPDEYKLVNQVAAGFESILCWWCTINKNVDRINYIHYNVQKLGNWTQSGFEAVHGQLTATSLMAFQNRIALDMLLVEKGGVCAMFGEQCCSFIPNNTAADGSLTKAIEGLRTLNGKMKEHSGVDTSMWDSWMSVFGKYRALVSSVLVSIAVFAAILTLCGCCCVPCLRALVNRLITTAITPVPQDYQQQLYPLLDPSAESEKDDIISLLDLFPDPEDSV